MLSIVHFSDLHFGPHFQPAAAEAALRAIQRLRPGLLVVSGDFTHRAKRGQFAAAREFLGRLPDVPTVVTPGNHDVPLYRFWERLFRPLGNYSQAISAQRNSRLALDGAVVVALDSTSPYTAITNGRLREEQLAWAAAAFREAPPQAHRIVVTHHPLVPAPDAVRSAGMQRGRRVLAAFVEQQVDVVLSGHLHRGYVLSSHDVLPGSQAAHSVLLVHSGTTSTSRGRAAEKGCNSFNYLELHPQGIVVQRHVRRAEEAEFSPTERREWPIQPVG